MKKTNEEIVKEIKDAINSTTQDNHRYSDFPPEHFRFEVNDDVIFQVKKTSVIGSITVGVGGTAPEYGQVVRYQPEYHMTDKRLLVKNTQGKEFYLPLQDVLPMTHQIMETRTRMYVTSNDPYKELHELMDQHILCFPLYTIGSKLSTSESLLATPATFFTVTHIVPLPSLGFIYFGETDGYYQYKCRVDLYNTTGELKDFLFFDIEPDCYMEILKRFDV